MQRYEKPLLEHIQEGRIDPTFVITHHMPSSEAEHGYETVNERLDNCEKIVLRA